MVLNSFQYCGIIIFLYAREEFAISRYKDGIFGRNDTPCDVVWNWDDGGGSVDDASDVFWEICSDGVWLSLRMATQGSGSGRCCAACKQKMEILHVELSKVLVV